MRYHPRVDMVPRQAYPMRTILFICTGNTCRSPMAEGIARHHLADREDDVFVASAGVAAFEGGSPSLETIRALESLDIRHEGCSTPLTGDMIRKASHVLCMTSSHQAAARAMVADDAEAQARIEPLDPNGDLPDPIGQGQHVYDALAERLMELIPERLDTLLKEDHE